MLGGLFASAGPMYYPKIYNIETDPHEDLQLPNHLWQESPYSKRSRNMRHPSENIRTRRPET